jgi:hypothetical protein
MEAKRLACPSSPKGANPLDRLRSRARGGKPAPNLQRLDRAAELERLHSSTMGDETACDSRTDPSEAAASS